MVDLSEYGFKENPFPLTPDYRVTNWAGREDTKRLLLDVVQSVLVTDTGLSEFVILLGTFGAGKTHSLRYLSTLINEIEPHVYNSKAIYVPKVQIAPKISFLSIYFQIIQELGNDFLKNLASGIKDKIKKAAKNIGEQYDREKERQLLESDPYFFINKAIESVPREDRPMIELLNALDNGDSSVEKFFLDGKTAITSSAFSQPINTDYMAIRVLAGLFRAMTIEINGQSTLFSGVHLFIDEVEELMEAKAAEQMSFWQAIRELVNRLPYNFALLLSFTADTALLEATMPEAIAERTSRQIIYFEALDIDEAKSFLSAHFESFRPEGYSPPQPFHPFNEEAVDFILEQTVVLVPRKIFRSLRTVLERAIKREGLEPGEEITASLAEEIFIAMGI